jgi:predicted dehydrogenase
MIAVRKEVMLKIAIIGCGKIADAHASQIQRIKGCEIVGVCDTEPLMARQLYQRFAVKQYYVDVGDLLVKANPDVVHITTPPESHFELARRCLESGSHVYVEKPFTINAREAGKLVSLADEKGLKLTVGHDAQFSHGARRMRTLIQDGYLGGPPVHMESHYCYDLTAPGYAKALLGDKQHWVRRLPGKLLHNIISHGIAKIAEYLTTDEPKVIAHGFVSPLLKAIGEHDVVDELRVIVSEEERTTAYFTFSSQMRPSIHQFRVYGPKNGLMFDQDQEAVIKLPGDRFKSYLEKFIPPILLAKQYLCGFQRNMRLFLANDFHMSAGMKCLIEAFYSSIRTGGAVPIPYREIILTAKIMDAIFVQLDARGLQEPFSCEAQAKTDEHSAQVHVRFK